ncbi:MAG: hypothetical protein ACRDJ3_05960 [Solirubrobacteraceae bacterium]
MSRPYFMRHLPSARRETTRLGDTAAIERLWHDLPDFGSLKRQANDSDGNAEEIASEWHISYARDCWTF